MRKFLALALALAIALGISSCSAENGGGYAFTLMGKKSDLEKSYMTAIFGLYEKTTGNKIKIISYEDSEYETRAAADFESGNAPDVFMHFHNAEIQRFHPEKNFYYLNNESWVSDLTDSAKAYCQDGDGNLLGLPFWESSVSGCYYNKTILDGLGLKPATTQREFDTLCQVLADTGYTPICWPADGCTWILQFGLDPIFADDPEMLEKINSNEISYSDIPEVADMFGWIAEAAEKGWLGNGYLETGWDDISPAMSSGSAVMTFIWDTWFYTDFKPGKYTIDDFALMPVFLNTVENGTYEGGNLNMMTVNKNSERLEEALGFLEFCADPENYNLAFDGISTVSCFNRQTTNIQSKMVTDARESIAECERISTAASRIIGYSADDANAALVELLRKKTDVAGCVKQLDEKRLAEIQKESD